MPPKKQPVVRTHEETFHKFTMLRVGPMETTSSGSLELLLRHSDVRLAVWNSDRTRTLCVVMTREDFGKLIEFSNVSTGPQGTKVMEAALLSISSGDLHNYVEIWLHSTGIMFTVTAQDGEAIYADSVTVSSSDFAALIERCRLHRFK